MATSEPNEKPVQHRKVDDVTSLAEAKKVFLQTTSEIKSKEKLNAEELHQIHYITYSLEKSIAYYAENLSGKEQQLAKNIAIVVEDIHIASENNRKQETLTHLTKYFKLAKKLKAII